MGEAAASRGLSDSGDRLPPEVVLAQLLGGGEPAKRLLFRAGCLAQEEPEPGQIRAPRLTGLRRLEAAASESVGASDRKGILTLGTPPGSLMSRFDGGLGILQQPSASLQAKYFRLVLAAGTGIP